MTRDPQNRLKAGFFRLLALVLACALCFHFALGSGVSCVVAALGEDACDTPCGANLETKSALSDLTEPLAEVGALGEKSSTECPCPFDCSLGCGAQSRAVAFKSLGLEVVPSPCTTLPEHLVRPMPAAAEQHGIMHVPKRTA
ncbi:MAG: hypothetical protein SFV15_16595 [Polyangiaceae bacterium]|nr:hypothetical protein [Polyangiaceae bacterium]